VFSFEVFEFLVWGFLFLVMEKVGSSNIQHPTHFFFSSSSNVTSK
jgi:hypothetical protein